MFRFNFQIPPCEEATLGLASSFLAANQDLPKENLSTPHSPRIEWVTQDSHPLLPDGSSAFVTIRIPDSGVELECVDTKFLNDDLTSLIPSITPHVPEFSQDSGGSHHHSSDLLPGVYEGGLKVWEGSLDLVQYMYHHRHEFNLSRDSTFKVLEIGCGAALPAIYAYLSLKQGDEDRVQVTVQDYNPEVLVHLTRPNVRSNLRRHYSDWTHKCLDFTYLSGDWQDVRRNLNPEYNLILSAETIYSPHNYAALHNLLCSTLLKPAGVAIFAAKSQYFGVGGSVAEFVNYINTQQCLLASVVSRLNCTAGLERNIIEIKWLD